MPLKSYTCRLCGAKCPKAYLAHSKSKERMSWLRNHRKRYHPREFEASIRKGVRARKARK